METDFEKLMNHIEMTVPPMEGWCSVAKAQMIAKLIVANKAKLYVEIGVFGGRSLIPAAMAMRHQRMGVAHGIDPWERAACTEGTNDPENAKWWNETVPLEKIYDGFVKKVKDMELQKWCFWRRERGEQSVKLYEDGIIDVLHLDGNHSEECSTRDVELWLPKIASNGVIIFDDADWQTTRKAQEMIAQSCVEIYSKQEDNKWVVYQKQFFTSGKTVAPPFTDEQERARRSSARPEAYNEK